jgi:hypothetical protein
MHICTQNPVKFPMGHPCDSNALSHVSVNHRLSVIWFSSKDRRPLVIVGGGWRRCVGQRRCISVVLQMTYTNRYEFEWKINNDLILACKDLSHGPGKGTYTFDAKVENILLAIKACLFIIYKHISICVDPNGIEILES